MEPILIEGARVVLDDRIERASVRIEGGRITGIDTARDGASVLDAKGKILAPAFVDIHGDAFERQIADRQHIITAATQQNIGTAAPNECIHSIGTINDVGCCDTGDCIGTAGSQIGGKDRDGEAVATKN